MKITHICSAKRGKTYDFRGFTLIEMLVFLFIFVLIVVTFYSTWVTGTRYILLAKNRLTANALANEKMEIVRNLAYDDIGHTTSDPPGNLHQEEDVIRSGRSYHVLTQIRNVDDSFDGTLGGSPTDANYVDYKFVKITVSWDGGQQSMSLSSRFVPAGIEQPMAGRGVLVVNVTSDKNGGETVTGSSIHIRNADTGYDEIHSVDSFGRLILVGLTESIKKYQITLTKNGWETVTTLPPYPNPPDNYMPTHEHASVVGGAVNTIDMYQNQLSNMLIRTHDYLGNALPSVNYHLVGGRKVGTQPILPNDPVYNTDAHEETNNDGERDYQSISPGQYAFTLEEPDHVLIGIDSALPLSLSPGETKVVTVRVSPTNVTALFIRATKADDGASLPGATIHLTNGTDSETVMIIEISHFGE